MKSGCKKGTLGCIASRGSRRARAGRTPAAGGWRRWADCARPWPLGAMCGCARLRAARWCRTRPPSSPSSATRAWCGRWAPRPRCLRCSGTRPRSWTLLWHRPRPPRPRSACSRRRTCGAPRCSRASARTAPGAPSPPPRRSRAHRAATAPVPRRARAPRPSRRTARRWHARSSSRTASRSLTWSVGRAPAASGR